MSYFNYHPVLRDYIISNTKHDITDISIRSKFIEEYKANKKLHVEYTIQDGERPEMIAHRFYDDINLFWVVMLFNEVHDLWNDWPLSNQSLNEYIIRKYPNESYNNVMVYYSVLTGAIIDKPEDVNANGLMPITYYEYEQTLNELKREIILPIPSEISNIVKYHRTSIGG